MRQKRRRHDADERPNRRRRALRGIEEREWEEELRHADEAAEHEDGIPAVHDDPEAEDDAD